MRTFEEVRRWIVGAAEEFGDPAAPVGQLFFRWREDLDAFDGEDLACGMRDGELVLYLGPVAEPLPLPVSVEGATYGRDGELLAFGLQRLTEGPREVWTMTPSLNIRGLIHGFVVLYDVPTSALERRIVVARSL